MVKLSASDRSQTIGMIKSGSNLSQFSKLFRSSRLNVQRLNKYDRLNKIITNFKVISQLSCNRSTFEKKYDRMGCVKDKR